MTTTAAAPSGTRERSRVLLLELRDRGRVSDPALARLRAATQAVVAVGTALGLHLLLARLLGYPSQAGFATAMFGAVVAMLAANALGSGDRPTKARTAVGFPFAVAAGLLPAAAVAGRQPLVVVGFGVVLFGAVWVRRFGPQWFFYGFMAWMGFFFATFLQVSWALVPELLLAAVVSGAWVLLLSVTVFNTRPAAVLHSTLAACFSSGRAVAREAADLLESAPAGRGRDRATRALDARLGGLATSALLAEAWSAEPGAVPDGWSPSALRRRMLEAQQAVERYAGGARQLTGPPDLVAEAARTLDHVAARRDVAARLAADSLREHAARLREAGDDRWWGAALVAHGVVEFLDFDEAAALPPEVDPGEEEFESATGLVFGGLPGAPSVSRDVTPRGFGRNPLVRRSATTRQAVQVMVAGLLALAAGFVLSPQRYYWAVIAAFITFAGTGTRSETLVKGAARIGGTLLGLVGAILLAHLTAGSHPAAIVIILVSVFLAFYLQKVSYVAMTFFITVMLGQLYTLLGTFSDAILALRLEETAVGAGVGVLVALVLVPVSTRDTIRAARTELLTAMADQLDAVAAQVDQVDHVDRPGQGAALDALTRRLDDSARRVTMAVRPMTNPWVPGSSATDTRRRLQLYVAAVSQCRALALAVVRDRCTDPGVSAVAQALARGCRAMAADPDGRPDDASADLVGASAREVLARTSGRDEVAALRHLHHLSGTLARLADVPESASAQVRA